VEYFPEIEHQPVVMTDRTIGWNFFLGGSTAIWPMTFTAEPADGRTAEQVVDAIQGDKFPDATIAFSIPGAGLGYNPGAGNVYDATFRTAEADSVPARLLIVASVRNGLAVYMTAIGPIDSNWGMPHPNPSETRAGNLASALVNGVIFPGDTPK
jgi:hypothetical protein